MAYSQGTSTRYPPTTLPPRGQHPPHQSYFPGNALRNPIQNVAGYSQTLPPPRGPLQYPQHQIYPPSVTAPQTALAAQCSPTVIFVMGETGVGKSTFIRTATGSAVKTDESLQSCTKSVQLYEIPKTNIYLADSPGLGDTYRDDASILKDLDDSLAALFHDQDVKLAGVLILHSMSEAKMKRGALRNLSMLRKLMGTTNMHRCRLVTTKQTLAPRGLNEIEDDLRENYWKELVRNGAIMLPFQDTKGSALQIIATLLDNPNNVVLKLTQETQRERRNLIDTAAGRVVNQELYQAKMSLQKDIEELEKDRRKAKAQRNFLLARDLEQQEAEDSNRLFHLSREEDKLQTRADASSWKKLRWMGRICATAAAGFTILASDGLLTPVVVPCYNHALNTINEWR